MKRIDLNVDIGEGAPHDEALLRYATSANICCGEHAGSWKLTTETVALCKAKGVRYGAHPGYPDRVNMGRREMGIQEIHNAWPSLLEQTQKFAALGGARYLKPHGAFYNQSATWEIESEADPNFVACMTLVGILQRIKLPLMGLAKSRHLYAADAARGMMIREGFADRAYLNDGTLKPRGEPGAILEGEKAIKTQVLALAPRVDTICLHGDTPNCIEYAEFVKKTLLEAGYEVRA